MKTVVLICGKMRTGKNTLSDFIQSDFVNREFTVHQDAFANSLKDYCSEDFKDLEKILDNYCSEVIGNLGILYDLDKHPNLKAQYDLVCNVIYSIKTVKENWYENKNSITRSILQTVGTNLIRNRVDSDFWVKKFIEKSKEYSGDIIICSDVRFPNEIELVHNLMKDCNIVSINVDRKTGINDKHPSENALDNFNCFNYVVENNGSLQDFKNSASIIVQDIVENYLV